MKRSLVILFDIVWIPVVCIFVMIGLFSAYIPQGLNFFLLSSQELLAPTSVQTQLENGTIWGVDFSQSQAEYLQLNWKDTYSAIINDLKVRHIKLHTNWDWVEGEKDQFFFNDIDWQIEQAEQSDVKIIYVVGMKTGRWPECHIPTWAEHLSEEQQQASVLKYITTVVSRYKNSKAIRSWQIENEPLLKFGECPAWYYNNDDFLRKEVALVKSLDPSRSIVVSDSGELSNWLDAASIGNIVGITMYRNRWPSNVRTFGTSSYSFLDPAVYAKKARLIKSSFGKDVIGIELQAEPWASKPLMVAPLQEQIRSMNLDMFKEDITFAKQTGLNEFYFWGVEWWYWMKETKNQPEIWNEAKQLLITDLRKSG